MGAPMTLSEFETKCRIAGVRAVRVWMTKPDSVDVIATVKGDDMFATYGEPNMGAAFRTIVGKLEARLR